MNDIEYVCEQCLACTYVEPKNRGDGTYEIPIIICYNCETIMKPKYCGNPLE